MHLDRRRLRAANGIGFALTVFYALWLVVFLLATLKAGIGRTTLPLPRAYAVAGGLSLVAMVALFAVLFFRFAWHGHDLSGWKPRLYLFLWTCAGCVFFLSQGVALWRFGSPAFPNVPGWLSDLYWYFTVVGAVTFGLLMWVNADGAHLHASAPEGPDDEDYETGHA